MAKKPPVAAKSGKAKPKPAALPDPFVTSENFREIDAADLNGALASTKHDFDPQAADNLLRYFAYALRDGDLSHHKLVIFLDFIGKALGRYVDGKPLEVAFGLKRGRGQRKSDDPLGTEERNMQIAAFITLRLRRNPHLTVIDVEGDAVNHYFPEGDGERGGRACRAAYEKYKSVTNLTDDKTLESLIL